MSSPLPKVAYISPMSSGENGNAKFSKRYCPNMHELAIPEDAMYGFAEKLTKSLGAPWSWAYPAVITIHAGQGVKVETPYKFQTNLFTLQIGKSGRGKSRTKSRILEAARHLKPGHIENTVVASDRGLISMFESEVAIDPRPCCVYADEGIATLKKIGIEGSSLAQTLNEAFNETRLSVSDKKGQHTAYVELSLLMNVTIEDVDDFVELFGANTRTGFANRCIYAPGPEEMWDWDDEWIPQEIEYPLIGAKKQSNNAQNCGLDDYGDAPLTTAPTIPSEAWQRLKAWRKEAPEGSDRGRLGEIVMRVAAVTAAMNNDQEITDECMSAALKLGEWQEAVRRVFSPGKAATQDAVVSNAILKAFQEHDEKHPGQYVSFSTILKAKSWYARFGARVAHTAKEALVRTGVLLEPPIEKGETAPKCPLLRLNPEFRIAKKAGTR